MNYYLCLYCQKDLGFTFENQFTNMYGFFKIFNLLKTINL